MQILHCKKVKHWINEQKFCNLFSPNSNFDLVGLLSDIHLSTDLTVQILESLKLKLKLDRNEYFLELLFIDSMFHFLQYSSVKKVCICQPWAEHSRLSLEGAVLTCLHHNVRSMFSWVGRGWYSESRDLDKCSNMFEWI